MFGTLSIITFAFIAIVVLAFVWPLNFSRRTKVVLSLLVCLMPCKSYISLFVGGTPFDPEIPYNLTFLTDLGRSALIFLALLVIIRSILNGLTKLIKWSWQTSLIPAQSPFYALLVFILAFGLAAYGTSCGYGTPELKKYQITMDKLDPRLDGMKIIHLADIHVSAPTDVKMIYNMVNRINALEPDLVLIPGDIIDGDVKDRKPITDLLFDLKAKYGVFIGTGNHEYYSGYTQWRKYFEDGGFVSLDNKVMALTDDKGKTLLNLGGITDPGASRFNMPMPDIKGVTTAIDASAPSIVLSHRPEPAHELAASTKVDLVLSGHTHGGLVIGLDHIVAKANGGFVSGLYDLVNNTKLIVSNGTMIWMGFPLRIGVPSQIIEITLHSKQRPNSQTYSLTRKGELQRLKDQVRAKMDLAVKNYQERKATANTVLSMEDNPNHETLTFPESNQGPENTAVSMGSQHTPQTQATSEQNASLEQNVSPDQFKPDFANVQLILEMTDAQSGQVHNNVTNLAVLPDNLTNDQLARIQKIIDEPPVKNQPNQDKATPESQKPSYVPSVHLKLIKDDMSKTGTQTKTEQPTNTGKATTEQSYVGQPKTTSSQPMQVNTPHNNVAPQNKQQSKASNVSIGGSTSNVELLPQANEPQASNVTISQNKNQGNSLVSFGINSAQATTLEMSDSTQSTMAMNSANSTASTNTAIELEFDSNDQQDLSTSNHLYATLDFKELEEEDIIEPFGSSRSYFPASDGEIAGGSNSLEDELNMELQIVYSLSLGEGDHPLLQEKPSVQELIN